MRFLTFLRRWGVHGDFLLCETAFIAFKLLLSRKRWIVVGTSHVQSCYTFSGLRKEALEAVFPKFALANVQY